MSHKYRGIIVKVVEHKNIGFIKPEEGSRDIFFHFSVVVEKDRPLLEKYTRVKYKYDAEKNKALKIWVMPKKHQIHKVKYAERNKRENYLKIGKLVKGVKGLSVQYEHRTVKACIRNLSMYTLQPVENDEVIFTKPTRLYDFSEVVKIKRYSGIRSAGECIKYFEELDGFLNSNNWCKVIEDVCENKAQWDFFGSLEMPFEEDFNNFFYILIAYYKLYHEEVNIFPETTDSKFVRHHIKIKDFLGINNSTTELDAVSKPRQRTRHLHVIQGIYKVRIKMCTVISLNNEKFFTCSK